MGSETDGFRFVHLSVVLMIGVEQVVAAVPAHPQTLGSPEPVGIVPFVNSCGRTVSLRQLVIVVLREDNEMFSCKLKTENREPTLDHCVESQKRTEVVVEESD